MAIKISPGARLRLRVQVEGLQEIIAALKGLKQAVRSRVLKKGLGKGMAILRAAVRRKVPRRTGLLKKAIGTKAKAYRSGVVVAMVGVRKGFLKVTPKGKRINPTKYAHLVEFGTGPHTVGKGSNYRKDVQKGRLHPGAKAQPFMRPAYDESKARVKAAVAEGIKKALQAEIAKLARKRLRAG